MVIAQKADKFIINVFKLSVGNLYAQIIGVIAVPLLTRIFAPSAFGLYALFTSIVTILGMMACLRYEITIVLPEKEEEAVTLTVLSFCFTVITTLVISLLVFFCGKNIARYLNMPGLSGYLWMLPLAAFVLGAYTVLNFWNTRKKDFGTISLSRVLASTVDIGMKIGLGFLGYATGGILISTTVLGNIASLIFLALVVLVRYGSLFKKYFDPGQLLPALKRYVKFPLLSSGSFLLNSISLQVPVWILAVFFSSEIVGF
ncbi:MAG: oligosaccharide flippase family protein, partial [Candidatus Omnitrophica bacterium]|nr:oligosaccharide flippase family protein [Candidatus Omnitrophota bacterium]